MNGTPQHDALGYSSTQEIAQILQGRPTGGHHLSKGEHEKNIKFLSLFDAAAQIDSALYALENYTD